jgi:hypothetical protein
MTTRIREDQQRLRLRLEDRRLVIQDPITRYPLFGAGSAACVDLALVRSGLAVLVNEVKPYREAVRLGLRAIAVPEIVVRLVAAARGTYRRPGDAGCP